MKRSGNQRRLRFSLTRTPTSAIVAISGRQGPVEQAVLAAARLTLSLVKDHPGCPFYVHWTEEIADRKFIQFEIASRNWTEFEAIAKGLGFDHLLRIEHTRVTEGMKIVLIVPEEPR